MWAKEIKDAGGKPLHTSAWCIRSDAKPARRRADVARCLVLYPLAGLPRVLCGGR